MKFPSTTTAADKREKIALELLKAIFTRCDASLENPEGILNLCFTYADKFLEQVNKKPDNAKK